MTKITIKVCSLSVALLLIFATSFAKIPQPKKNTYVNDYAGVLTKSQIKALNVKIHKLERINNVQLAIVLVKKLPAEYDIEDFSLLIARKWQVGVNKRGLVYVAAIKQRKQRLEVSRMLDTTFNDANNIEILDNIKPFFREADYSGGLQSLVSDITDLTTPVVPAPEQVVGATSPNAEIDESGFNGGLIVIYAICAIFGYIICKLIYLLILGIISRKDPKPPIDLEYGDQLRYGGYQRPYGGSRTSSGFQSQSGSFITGAATGYADQTIQDHDDHDDNHHHTNHDDDSPEAEQSKPVSNDDNDSRNYGIWGSRSSSSRSSRSSGSSSSSSNGYSGSGTTSDW